MPAARAAGAQRKKVPVMTDVACFCGCCFSFDAGAADTRNLTTESDEGSGGRAAGSGAISAGYLYLQSQDLRSPSASRPGAQGRLRPEHRKRRGSSAVPAHGNRYAAEMPVCQALSADDFR